MTVDVDMFAYLAAFVTIVLALAVSDMVQSTHRLLSARGKVNWDLLPILSAAFVFLSVLSEFFALWRVVGVETFTFYQLVALMVTPILFALAACAALPDSVPDAGLDLGQFYFEHRTYLFAVIAIAYVADFARNYREAWVTGAGSIPIGHDLWWWVLPLTLATVILCGLLAWSVRRWVHLAGLLTLLAAAHFGFSTWTIQDPSAPETSVMPSPQ